MQCKLFYENDSVKLNHLLVDDKGHQLELIKQKKNFLFGQKIIN